MRRTTIAATLLVLSVGPAVADDWLDGDSYVCRDEDKLDALQDAIEIGNFNERDQLLNQGCYLINNAARVFIRFTDGDKTFFNPVDTQNRPKLWTWSRNITSE